VDEVVLEGEQLLGADVCRHPLVSLRRHLHPLEQPHPVDLVERLLGLREGALLEEEGPAVGCGYLHSHDPALEAVELGPHGSAEVVEGVYPAPLGSPDGLHGGPVPRPQHLVELEDWGEEAPVDFVDPHVEYRDLDVGHLPEHPTVEPRAVPLPHPPGQVSVSLPGDALHTVEAPGRRLQGSGVARVPRPLPPGLEELPALLQGPGGVPDLHELLLGHPGGDEVGRGIVLEEGREDVDLLPHPLLLRGQVLVGVDHPHALDVLPNQ